MECLRKLVHFITDKCLFKCLQLQDLKMSTFTVWMYSNTKPASCLWIWQKGKTIPSVWAVPQIQKELVSPVAGQATQSGKQLWGQKNLYKLAYLRIAEKVILAWRLGVGAGQGLWDRNFEWAGERLRGTFSFETPIRPQVRGTCTKAGKGMQENSIPRLHKSYFKGPIATRG